ncbi:TetM/TetW/TetO/TetS family tetracycline resistance ribosomal protection protein [Saccharopolyspora erythraea]|uniref:elongation factor G n=1 Tax=Saccharopolyspora erythraea TaxID=1836 RepID=UPI001BA6DBB0|nr:TetM/TetW/TetO/TetS family tetracycline resistance ribosomal protection protein [Saccharopolyspora erythraea]QUH02431.1 TetM/TetW/TetO/TetS family tetracycline resistance ribosomal protection protein [Saccharopolyspora erythraea]
MRTLNLGILAHVDAGKTSLTERLLHAAGVIDEVGSVDAGSTRTDSTALERRRGITIKSAVVSFVVDDVAVNLIDTPGHPDFIAEVERALGVLDGAVLVISAVEGVQAQTRLLMRTLRRLRIPTLVFVNKIDRAGARHEELLRDITGKVARGSIPMGTPVGLGRPTARYVPFSASDRDFAAALLELLAEHDDALLAAYVDGVPEVSHSRLRRELAAQTSRALAHPVFFGSAITGAGVEALMSGMAELLPASRGDEDGPVSGTVFKVEREAGGSKVAHVRMFSGTVRVREAVRVRGQEHKVTAIHVFDRGSAVRRQSVAAGRIARLSGLGDVRIGDAIGVPRPTAGQHHFSPPTLESVVLARHPADRPALHTALGVLAEQDPLIGLRHDGPRGELSVSLYGEVQKQVIQATLADEHGIEVTFRETTTICVERPAGSGSAVEVIGEDPNPFLATVGLRVDPGEVGTGVEFRLAVELGSLPAAFVRAVEETVRETLSQGLCGWQVTDCVVTMTRSGYWARQSHSGGVFDKSMSSTAGDFRNLAPLVLMDALRQATTTVHEPVHRFRVEIPSDTCGIVLSTMQRLRAVPRTSAVRDEVCVVEGDVPAAWVHELEQRLPGLTRGEAVLESAFDRYEPVRGPVPTRPRSDHNPLDRKEYLLRVARRV